MLHTHTQTAPPTTATTVAAIAACIARSSNEELFGATRIVIARQWVSKSEIESVPSV